MTDRAGAGSVEPTAPYAFIPLVSPLPSPFGDNVPSHSRPLEDGVCGHIDVEWVFERPVLVGGADTTDGWASFAVNSRNEPVLPGGTTRGLVRSLLEIATGSRMDHYDHDAHFALRDSSDERVWKPAMPSSPGRALSFGWLRPSAGKRVSGHDFDGWVIEIVQRAQQLETSTVVADVESFETKTVAQKMAELVECGRLHIRADVVAKENARHFEEKTKARYNARGNISGWVVVTGVDPARLNPSSRSGSDAQTPKKYATIFVDQERGKEIPVPSEIMRRFIRTHDTSPGEGKCTWDYWMECLSEGMPTNASGDRLPGIPVFIGHVLDGIPVGQQNNQKFNPRENQQFRNQRLTVLLEQMQGPAGQRRAEGDATLVYLSLSRFVKVPHARSLRNLIESQNHVHDMRLDFARALFGQVPPEKMAPEIEEKPGRGALKGRVSFEEAVLTSTRSPAPPLPMIGATMSPRASFWPYYLSPGNATNAPYDYSNPTSRIAGWKRYPVRAQSVPFLRDDRPNAGTVAAGEARRTEAKMRFLPATTAAPLRFRGRIHLHNVKPAEVGALLWSLTWGGGTSGEKQPQRHQVGRGKPQGYGVCFCRVEKLDLTTNLGVPPKTAQEYISDFRSFVRDTWNASGNGAAVAEFEELPIVAPLLAMADPTIASGLEPRLIYPSVPKRAWQGGAYGTPAPAPGMSRDSSPSLEGYKAVRKAAKDNPDRSVLPPYPRS